jgi:excisionase family DNA binding protein
MEPVMLTVPEVMARLRVGRHTVYALIRSRRLVSVTIGRSRRVPVAAVDTYVADLLEGRA